MQTTVTHRRSLLSLLFVGLMALLVLLPVAVAVADEGEETPPAGISIGSVGDENRFQFTGNVRHNSEPLEGVRIYIDDNGYFAEVLTDERGRWKIGVPEKVAYTITLDELTLPEGVIVAEGGASRLEEFGLTGSKSVNFFLGEGVRVVISFWDQLTSRLVNGLNFGLMLALASIGASLIYGTTGLANFAHSEFVTFGALIAFVVGVAFEVPIWLAIPIAVALTGALGYFQDIILWKPLRRRGMGLAPLMIVSIGLAMVMRYVFQFAIGGDTLQLPGAGQEKITFIANIQLSVIDIVSMGVSIVVLIAVALWLMKSKLGKATRAVSDNASLAAASGIDVDRVVRVVWVVAASLAGLGGILWAYFRPGIRWDMGMQVLMLIFAAIILGGIGTAFGALVGSIIIGILVETSTLWIPSDLKYVGALVALIVVLLFKPQGLLGRKERVG